MTRKIIIDCDPGIDDAIAILIALFDPRVEVLAITATAGTVEAQQATRNVTALVNHLDPARYPRIGTATPSENAPVLDDSHLNGPEGLGECRFEASGRQHPTPSEKIISELVHQHPDAITLVCLGPLTNLARLIRREPSAIPLINNIVISGGSIGYPGNATTIAERNMFFDAQSAAEVFASATTKSLVPLDVTEEVLFGVDLLEHLPSKFSKAGDLLHKMLPFAFRTAHQKLGRELIPLYDATTMLSVMEPELFEWEGMAGKVETKGELTRGATVFDQRLRREWPMNMEVAVEVDVDEAQAAITRSLKYAGQKT
ncbi:Pyrimidine-specific ribonucleoside hydrolase RihB [Rubripirellula lacrimiformis]|uniref:Pyrimidine-specific ribonucleoside hydrolase RihB n=1 Tax=Rubripirellula lacrimiformis TaxID=1930273 RepID=A0A517NK58_9BACT|nr:nucleoside hydrolase [Rubripirellula lacrimiformis]QDT07524.1 Pyrimidine-specific ribonucleoside hydrolase RihB [Rubripirellula lacrimiformis]